MTRLTSTQCHLQDASGAWTVGRVDTGAAEAERDESYWGAVELVVSQRQASISFIQRRLGLGYPKAARFIDLMEQDRIIGPGDGAKPRQILVGPDYLVRRGAPR